MNKVYKNWVMFKNINFRKKDKSFQLFQEDIDKRK